MTFSTTDMINNITGSRRLRRNRMTPWARAMVRENTVTPDDLILPLFIIDGKSEEEAIEAMPGVSRRSVDKAVELTRHAASLGIPAVAPFPNVDLAKRDQAGSAILDPDNLICRYVKAVKDAGIDIGIITDSALDPFTDHGHDGVLRDGVIVNDESVEQIVKASILQAQAGADIIAPSDMMDGRIGAIRQALDAEGFSDTAIMSYTAKYASGFYGPYREAIGTDQTLKGDKATYYIDPANSEDAMREAEMDIAEGADSLMVKPGMPYLDIIWRMKSTFGMPVFAYQVSGEYSMIEAAAANGWLDGERAMMESIVAFKRAGADGILSYFAIRVAEKLHSS
ncbi:porphobilinogen synthase [Pseudahrensia aquimaris]|uniref:Delta-aminolevulinic acid dehydratase n=1 Tax=Pseudahrensia aquimaris TaxID=744461 RepID=A0ABW3FAY1_9HYPH